MLSVTTAWPPLGCPPCVDNPLVRSIRIPIVDAIECMVAVLGQEGPPILLCSPVDAQGFVVSGNAFLLQEGLPSVDVLFELPRRQRASAVLFGSRATRSVFDPDDFDTELFVHLLAGAESAGIPLVEHVLISGQTFRLMIEASRS